MSEAFSDKQIMAAKAIFVIETFLEPKCENCGVGAARPKCFHELGGGCPRHDQDDVRAYNTVLNDLRTAGDLRDVPSFRTAIPAFLLHGAPSKDKLALLLDLVERGGKQKTRAQDGRFEWFRLRNITSLSYQYDRHTVEITKHGRDYLRDLAAAGLIEEKFVSPAK